MVSFRATAMHPGMLQKVSLLLQAVKIQDYHLCLQQSLLDLIKTVNHLQP